MAETNSNPTKIPAVKWAQRTDCIFLKVEVPKAMDLIVNFESQKLTLTCKGGSDKVNYELVVDFFGEINPENSKFIALGMHIDMLMQRKETGPYWPRLTQEKKKQHWLSTDFGRWKDEDESDDEVGGGGGPGGPGGPGGAGDDPRGLNEMLANMGGMGGMAGMGGMGGMAGMPPGMQGLGGDVPDVGDEEDSDDEPIPDLEEAEDKETEGRSE